MLSGCVRKRCRDRPDVCRQSPEASLGTLALPLNVAELPLAYGAPVARGVIRSQPEDFQVDEELSFTPTGRGEHAFVRIRKTGTNTAWLARRLAKFAGVPQRDVGYAGLKDRHAIAEQWFSIGLGGRAEPDWHALQDPQLTILEVTRSDRKLRRGAVRRNRFHIRIRDLAADRRQLAERLTALGSDGVPNYFGEQRFGREGANVRRAQAMFDGSLRGMQRDKRSLYLSAARSQLFNAVLARRVSDGSWDRLQRGDVCLRDGRRGVFSVEAVDDELVKRMASQEIHVTGPLWGKGPSLARGAIADLEAEVAAEWETLRRGLEAAGLDQERRALRCRIEGLEWTHGAGTLELCFSLSAGCYATAVLREVLDYWIGVDTAAGRAENRPSHEPR